MSPATHAATADWAILEWTMSGTHRADLPGMPATGKSFSVRGATALALDGTSKGQMLSIGTATTGSAVYVAIERVEATLDGQPGTFSLHHTGIMNRGTPTLTIAVVPDSGTGALAGIRGTMSIDIRDNQHFYSFEYEMR